MTTAFPFPTFLLVELLSLAGRLSARAAYRAFVVLEIVLLAMALNLLYQVTDTETPPRSSDFSRRLVQAGLILHPVVLAGINLGQSSALAGVAAVGVLWCWRRGTSSWAWHGAAILANIAWMIKPQLAMATTYFVASWILDRRSTSPSLNRSAAIGRLIIPWALVLIAGSLLLAFPGHVLAFRDFPRVAGTWHTLIAEVSVNNYAPSAVVAKAAERILGLSFAKSLPYLTVAMALSVLIWNFLAMTFGRPDSLRAFLPWLSGCLLWTSLVWEHYLTFALTAPVLMLGLQEVRPAPESRGGILMLACGLGCTLVLSSFVFSLGVLLLYLASHDMLARDKDEHRAG